MKEAFMKEQGAIWWGTLFFCLLLAQASWATIYRWVDRQGQVHYGDQPDRSQAVRIEAVDPQTFVLPSFQEQQPGEAPEKKEEKQTPTLSIIQPKPGAELTTGSVTVRFSLKPHLAPGEGTVIAYLDGAEVARPRGTVFSIEILQEGGHELRLQVVDAQGKQIAQAAVLINVKTPWSKAGASNFELLKKLPPPPHPQAMPPLRTGPSRLR